MPGPTLSHLRALAVTAGAPERTDGELLEQFVARKDGTAFAALVSRHGRLVWGVCRNVLHHQQDCEDAFQATFLVLARKAASVRKAEALPGWLHGVAFRVAMKAKRSAARRRAHERAAPPAQTGPASESAWRELQAALDEEVQGLPARLRAPFVLCCLEGKGPADAAGQLGWKVSTVHTRLSQARQELLRRLARRGVSLSAALCAAALSREDAGAALPAALAQVTVRSALSGTAGKAAPGGASAAVAALAQGVTRDMNRTKGKIATVLFLLAGLLAAGVGVASKRLPATPPEPARPPAKAGPPAAPKADTARAEAPDEVAVSGRVLGADGRPFAGAKVFFRRLGGGPGGLSASGPAPAQATADARGAFRFRISRKAYTSENEEGDWLRGAVVGLGAGHGPGLAFVATAEQLADVTVKLVKDLPLEGRVVTLEGKAVPGARVRVREVFTQAKDGEDLRAWLRALRSKADGRDRPAVGVSPAVLGLTGAAVTGADGKFRLTGVGRERLVVLRFEGATIETSEAYALTHPTEKIGSYHGARFEYAAAPTRPIVGTVRDRETGKPVAGVTIVTPIPSVLGRREMDRPSPDLAHYLRATTDSKGRYRLVGLPRGVGPGHYLFAVPAPGQPYQVPLKPASGETEAGALKVDFELKPGVVIRGRVTDKETGKPAQARVEYFAAADNPNAREEDGITSLIPTRTAKDGSFTLVGAPGQGVLAARALDGMDSRYVVGAGADKIKITRRGFYFHTKPYWCTPGAYNVLAEINAARGARSVVCDLALDPGKTVTGTIVGPDGKPVQGVSIVREGSFHIPFHVQELPTAQFRLPAIGPNHPQAFVFGPKQSWTFVFRHQGRDLAAALGFKGDEAKPVTVRLQKCATLRGRLVDKNGRPRASIGLVAGASGDQVHIQFHGVRTDRDGRFRIEGIVPGLKVSVSAPIVANIVSPVIPGVTLKPGETRDVGDVKATQEPE
jgi:RNA polymerase sigma factor (sigma-70 family)